MGLLDKVTAQIAAQQIEIARVKDTARDELIRAQTRLNVLVDARRALTPELEALLDALAAVGVKVSIE